MIRTVIFDWGNTVMTVFPGFQGPMAAWPRVEAVPGVRSALRALSVDYRLALATNASDSGTPLVTAALERVGLHQYFDGIFTARELGLAKSDPGFFRAALRDLGCAPAEAVMVGDSYAMDVLPAKAAGMAALWYNPGRLSCPDDQPAHDAELLGMDALPGVLESRWLPDLAASQQLLLAHHVTPELSAHQREVARVAFRLAERLRAAGEPVDPVLAHRGGLLHDIAKIAARGTTQTHDDLAGQILREGGYPELAAIAERHAVWAAADPARTPITWEQRLVFYADRIVEGGSVVGIASRMAAILRRHPERATALTSYLPAARALEAEIADRLGLSSEEMVAWLQEGHFCVLDDSARNLIVSPTS